MLTPRQSALGGKALEISKLQQANAELNAQMQKAVQGLTGAQIKLKQQVCVCVCRGLCDVNAA